MCQHTFTVMREGGRRKRERGRMGEKEREVRIDKWGVEMSLTYNVEQHLSTLKNDVTIFL